MRILLVNNEFLPIGGGGSAVSYFVGRHLAGVGHEVQLITSSYKGLAHRERVGGILVHRVPAFRRHADSSAVWELLSFALSATWFGLRLVPKFRPDLVQAFFGVPSGGVAYVLHRVHGVPYAVYLGGSDVPGANPGRYRRLYPALTPFIRLFWKDASLVTAASRWLIDLGEAAAPEVEIAWIPNGVEIGRFRPAEMGGGNSPVRILAIGRLIRRKGFQNLVSAMPEVLRRTGQDVVVDIVGSGPLRDSLTRMVGRLGLESHVRLVGAVPYEDLHQIYWQSDIFVLPSLAEGMALVLLEAMASGLPVVATRVAGSEELVTNGENGYLVKPADEDSLAEALATLVSDADMRRRMAKASLARAAEYDWTRIARRYLDLYEEILKPA